mmetsp:Transcript_35422/g.49173  ORF Transcript_35422/g.49173 Transcript_35422/m.49173 type:complete len:536 (-) Transcript_35422:291-1898(-)
MILACRPGRVRQPGIAQQSTMTSHQPLDHLPILRFRPQSIVRISTSRKYAPVRQQSRRVRFSVSSDIITREGAAAPPCSEGEAHMSSKFFSESFLETCTGVAEALAAGQGGFKKSLPSEENEQREARKVSVPHPPAPLAKVRLSGTAPRVHTRLERLWEGVVDQVVLVGLLAVWYASNIFFNLYNKQVLQVFPHPTTCTLLHLLTATVLMGAMWAARLKKTPAFNKRLVDSVTPLSVMHLAGFLTTNMSLGAVNVSLTHTIKSLEPFFTVVLSYFFLGSVPSLPIVITLVPIVAGVVIASATDLSFNWYGFSTAMASNLAFQSRNVISKKYMVSSSLDSLEDGGLAPAPLDDVNLFACISIMATMLCIPAVFLLDGGALVARVQALGWGAMSAETLGLTLMAGVCRTVDVLTSYALLSRLNPVTHSVGNCVKRVVVIGVSILFFKTPASRTNIIGTAVALSGVFAYSMAKRAGSNMRLDLSEAFKAKTPNILEKILAAIVPAFVKNSFLNKQKPVPETLASADEPEDGEDLEYAL